MVLLSPIPPPPPPPQPPPPPLAAAAASAARPRRHRQVRLYAASAASVARQRRHERRTEGRNGRNRQADGPIACDHYGRSGCARPPLQLDGGRQSQHLSAPAPAAIEAGPGRKRRRFVHRWPLFFPVENISSVMTHGQTRFSPSMCIRTTRQLSLDTLHEL